MINIEIHDLHLDNYLEVSVILDFLVNFNFDKLKIMLIPDNSLINNNESSEKSINDFRLWLNSQEKKNSIKFYCHGWRHKADLKLPRNRWGKLINQKTNFEAEFSGLNKNDTRNLLINAQTAWEALVGDAVKCHGFVAPTWHGSVHLKKQSIDLGFNSLGTRFYWYNQNRREWSFPLSMFSQTEKDLEKSLKLSTVLLKLIPQNKVRIVLHPCDFDSDLKRGLMRDFFNNNYN